MSQHENRTENDPLGVSNENDWDDSDHLRELHVDRGVPAADIARAHDVDAATVRDRLKEIDAFQGRTHPPKSGFARKVWEHGIEEGASDGV